MYLRGNTYINYEQLGLKFKLYSCEVLFNRGLCYIYLQQIGVGLGDLSYAAKEKVTADHDVIDDAIREEAEVRVFTYQSAIVSPNMLHIGLHRIFHSSWYSVPPKQRQGQESQDQGLPGKGETYCSG